ncbi:MAG TPA: hypothetical protein PKI03_25065 [Pseudomonadota bacterium]|nr:hypothetical protein [Pseudomonadota bacterium]
MSFRMTCFGILLSLLPLTADARPLPRVLERARYLEPEYPGGCVGPSYRSPVYAAFQWVVQHFTKEELLALLQHPSAVVRAYTVQHLATQLPANSQALVPLLADAQTVSALPAERGKDFAIDEFVAEELCKHRSVPAIERALRRAAGQSSVRPAVRHRIRSCSMAPPTEDLLKDIPPASAAPAQPQ